MESSSFQFSEKTDLPFWKRPGIPFEMGLALLCTLGFFLRLRVAAGAAWFGDEGYVADLAQSLAHFQRPHLGAIWQDGFFPLSASYLAPLSAVPFVWLPHLDAMQAVRFWAVCLGTLSIFLMGRLGEAVHSRRLGFFTAALYAVMPFAVEFEGRGFYHHLGLALGLAALWRYALYIKLPNPAYLLQSAILAGLTSTACYWTWWLPAGMFVGQTILQRGIPWKVLFIALVAPLVIFSLNFYPDFPGALWSANNLFRLSSRFGPQGISEVLGAVWENGKHLPFLWLGPLALALAPRLLGARLRVWNLALFFSICAFLDPVRQRGNISALPYPFMLAAPWACLGIAAFLEYVWICRKIKAVVPALIALGLLVYPPNFSHLRLWSMNPDFTRQMQDFVTQASCPGDEIMGLSNFNWIFNPGLRSVEPTGPADWEGRDLAYFSSKMPKDRFSYPCDLDQVHYIVACRIYVLGLYLYPGIAMTFLEAEREGWPKVWENRDYKVFANPRFCGWQDPNVRILLGRDFYLRAAEEADGFGRTDLRDFAFSRLKGAIP